MNKYEHLLSPIHVGKRLYKNRVASAPRGGVWNDEPGNDHTDIEQIADAVAKCRGGVAVYEIGETAVSPSGGRGANEFYDFSDFSEGHMLRYTEYADAIHKNGALALVELCHMGMAKPENEEGAPAYGPSECLNEYGEKVKALTPDDIKTVAKEFADTAFFMKKAGFDGVNVHCGHGWLVHQFLSPRYNNRTDEFGGSIENRSRIAVLIADEIRKSCGEDFIIEARISGRENMPGAYTDEDIIEFCRIMESHIDLIHVSAGVYQKPMETLQNSTLYDAHGCNIEMAEKIKNAVKIPVAVVGGINNPDDAEKWIAEGKCDIVVLCRQLQADPEFEKKVEEERAGQIRKCIRCMRCYPGPFEEAMEELGGEFPEGCSVNPYLLHFDMLDMPKAGKEKNVLVIGGGVAGMQAALTSSRRGHKVTILERTDRLGG
ncbi:MAG: FAD-dependent oxidoreductase, partial [Eubacterium sp.]|nr:FAD-dependent oxidoreductase [Eubacterium sp.]